METSVDVEWAHAVAPGAKILLVEADSALLQDMLVAEDWAKTHAAYVSNSWGQSEYAGENQNDSHLSQSGTSIFFASGDSATPVYPASAPSVIAVGATTLTWDSAGHVSESGWAPSGGGCSAYESANSAQSSFASYAQVGCNDKRATPDVAANGAQASAVSVYDASPYNGIAGWWRAFGSSVPTPMWAARAADAGANLSPAYVYGSAISYRQITSGGNGNPCYADYNLCAGRGSWLG
jgi:subtilase family serine protease